MLWIAIVQLNFDLLVFKKRDRAATGRSDLLCRNHWFLWLTQKRNRICFDFILVYFFICLKMYFAFFLVLIRFFLIFITGIWVGIRFWSWWIGFKSIFYKNAKNRANRAFNLTNRCWHTHKYGVELNSTPYLWVCQPRFIGLNDRLARCFDLWKIGFMKIRQHPIFDQKTWHEPI